MIFNIMTLFNEMFTSFLQTSIIKRAINNDLIKVNLYNIRDYSKLKSKSVDDYVYGGGEGMLMMAEPIYDCYKDIAKDRNIKTLYLSPKGKMLNNELVKQLSTYNELIILCGHYEGVDERALQLINAEEISIGDYVLTGGELPAMILIDAISRFIPNVLSNEESNKNDSFNNGLLECPQWTRPYEFMGLKVPDILLTGNHKKIDEWKFESSIEITKKNRPDLYEKYLLNINGGKNE